MPENNIKQSQSLAPPTTSEWDESGQWRKRKKRCKRALGILVNHYFFSSRSRDVPEVSPLITGFENRNTKLSFCEMGRKEQREPFKGEKVV